MSGLTEGDRDRLRATARPSRLRFTDPELRAVFARFADASGRPLTSSAYMAWAKEDEDAPTVSTFLSRFGPSWAEVCVALGHEAPPSGVGRGRGVISEEACLGAVRRVQKTMGGRPPTAAQYAEMKAADDPAPRTVASRVGAGKWSGVVARLLA